MLQVHRELEEASAVSGAGLFATLRRVMLPLTAPGIFAAWSLLFIVFGRQFSLPVMLSASGTEVLTIMMFQEFDAGQMGHVAAFGILLVGASLPFLIVARHVARGADAA
jgi:iron(III) transport system permease protein